MGPRITRKLPVAGSYRARDLVLSALLCEMAEKQDSLGLAPSPQVGGGGKGGVPAQMEEPAAVDLKRSTYDFLYINLSRWRLQAGETSWCPRFPFHFREAL